VDEVAEGWVLVIGLAALFFSFSLAAVVLRGRRRSCVTGAVLRAGGSSLRGGQRP
jgi:hypothetical protein